MEKVLQVLLCVLGFSLLTTSVVFADVEVDVVEAKSELQTIDNQIQEIREQIRLLRVENLENREWLTNYRGSRDFYKSKNADEYQRRMRIDLDGKYLHEQAKLNRKIQRLRLSKLRVTASTT